MTYFIIKMVLNVSLDYLVGKTDVEMDKDIKI